MKELDYPKDKKDVKFTLPLSIELDSQVKEKAEKLGLSKIAYIRMVLIQSVSDYSK